MKHETIDITDVVRKLEARPLRRFDVEVLGLKYAYPCGSGYHTYMSEKHRFLMKEDKNHRMVYVEHYDV